jgi:hypothetical protein
MNLAENERNLTNKLEMVYAWCLNERGKNGLSLNKKGAVF